MTDKKYPGDLTDEEWEVVKMILLKEEGRSMGRPREVDLRRVWDAISYINKTGCHMKKKPASNIAMIDVASIRIMLKKLFPQTNEECLS